MLEQWQADRLLSMPKVYVETTTVDLTLGAEDFYVLESDDESENFFLDIRRGRRLAKMKATFQLRYGREIVLARLCTATPHTNPDGTYLEYPHFHSYREGFGDKYAEQTSPFANIPSALNFFCGKINLPQPDIQGGAS